MSTEFFDPWFLVFDTPGRRNHRGVAKVCGESGDSPQPTVAGRSFLALGAFVLGERQWGNHREERK